MSQAMKMMSLLIKVKTPSKPTKKDSSGSDDRSSSDEEKSAPKKSKKATPENYGCAPLDSLIAGLSCTKLVSHFIDIFSIELTD